MHLDKSWNMACNSKTFKTCWPENLGKSTPVNPRTSSARWRESGPRWTPPPSSRSLSPTCRESARRYRMSKGLLHFYMVVWIRIRWKLISGSSRNIILSHKIQNIKHMRSFLQICQFKKLISIPFDPDPYKKFTI